jgi:quercetin dioxygenase-like cupin family protein
MLQPTDRLQVNPANETIGIGGFTVHFLVTGKESNGTVAVFELAVPGSMQLPAPAHSHDHYEETIYGIEGTLTWTVEGKAVDVAPGQALCIPRGAVHRFDNKASADAKALCVITPAAIGPDYFRETFTLLKAGGPPDKAKLLEIMRRHGLTPVLSPTQGPAGSPQGSIEAR